MGLIGPAHGSHTRPAAHRTAPKAQNAPPDFPVGRRHDRIHTPGGGSRFFEQLNDSRVNVVLVLYLKRPAQE